MITCVLGQVPAQQAGGGLPGGWPARGVGALANGGLWATRGGATTHQPLVVSTKLFGKVLENLVMATMPGETMPTTMGAIWLSCKKCLQNAFGGALLNKASRSTAPDPARSARQQNH